MMHVLYRVIPKDWSLITGWWVGATKLEGTCEDLPIQKKGGGAEEVLAMLKGVGHKRFCGSVFYTVA